MKKIDNEQELRVIIESFKDGGDPLDKDDVSYLTALLELKMNLMEENITVEEYEAGISNVINSNLTVDDIAMFEYDLYADEGKRSYYKYNGCVYRVPTRYIYEKAEELGISVPALIRKTTGANPTHVFDIKDNKTYNFSLFEFLACVKFTNPYHIQQVFKSAFMNIVDGDVLEVCCENYGSGSYITDKNFPNITAKVTELKEDLLRFFNCTNLYIQRYS